jgi:hypothetical protein
MTPAELYEAVKPLWERDAGFRPEGLTFHPRESYVAYPKEGTEPKEVGYSEAFWTSTLVEPSPAAGGDYNNITPGTVEDPVAAALIRDRIVERCIEHGYVVEVGKWGVEIDGIAVSRNPDRTLALIEAALKATEKQG